MMEELRAILRRGRPGDDYWVAYWRLREELTKQLGCERMAVLRIRIGLAVPEREAA